MNEKTNVMSLLENSASLRCAVIGIGNAGNQLLNEASRNCLDVFAINSSKQDLSDALVDSKIRSFIIGNEARGAGKNRMVAKKLFKVNGKDLVVGSDIFKNMCADNDIIVVAAGTGGGTGSGISPDLIRILKTQYPNKIIIFYGILPRLSDSVTAQQNSLDCLIEIMNLNIPYMLADLDHYKGIANDVAYEEIGMHVVDTIMCIKGAYLNKSSYGMIDENDMRTTISTPGYISIYNVGNISQQKIDKQSVQSMVVDKIKSSPAVSIMRDGVVQNMAAIINMPATMTDSSKTGDYNELIDFIGRPMTIFENYAIVDSGVGQFILILTGLSTPITRTNEMDEICLKAKALLEKRKVHSISDNSYKRFEEQNPDFLFAEADSAEVDNVLGDIFD